MDMKARLLGLAFAAADALVEIDQAGVARFALGVDGDGAQAGAWVGQPLAGRFETPSLLTDAVAALKPGRRSEPLELIVICAAGLRRRCVVRLFLLPELAPIISCALIYSGPAFAAVALETPPLLETDAFLEHARRLLTARRDLAVAFVDVKDGAVEGESREAVDRRVAAVLQARAAGGQGATRLTEERYALLKLADDAQDIAAELREAGLAEGVTLEAEAVETAVPPGSEPLCALRALRFAIEGCLRDGGLAQPGIAFSDSLRRTLKEADGFRAMVKSREFALHFQPIVDLGTRAVHHFEALARFNGATTGPGPVIHMAEELALIESFDLAVAEKALRRMRQPGSGLLKLAVNVSGASLATDDYVAAVLKMTSTNPEDRRRLIVEVTESAALADIEAADRRIAALRAAGIKVCIDDFGVGAASFGYLQRLSVDAVKIDGSFVRDIESDPRAHNMIRTLVELCGSLGLTTIAEMIETEAAAAALKAIGVGFGQGWLFGKAEAEPRTQLATSAVARRRGAVEAWG